jgi:FkbM family methyltransferase
MGEKRMPNKIQGLQILRERQIPVKTVLDVGVCHGTPELITAYPDVRHELFEPVDEFTATIGRVYKNVDHALHLVAAGDSDGEVALRVSRVLEGMGISHSGMVNETPGGDPDVRSVAKVRLDTFAKTHGLQGPFLLKIDVDGHEMQVLNGSAGILADCSIVIVECAGSQLPDRIGFMQKSGFRLFDLSEPCYYDQCFWQCDAVFVSNKAFANAFKELKDGFVQKLYEKFG